MRAVGMLVGGLSAALRHYLARSVKVFHKDQSFVLSYSYSTLRLSVLLSVIRLSVFMCLLMTLNCSSPSEHLNYPPIYYTYKIQLISSLNGCLLIFSHSINLKLSFVLLVYLLNYLKSLLMPSNVTITPAKSACNLGVIFYSTLSMSDHISLVSKSCFLFIRAWSSKDKKNSRLFHCSHHLNLSHSLQTNWLQQIL